MTHKIINSKSQAPNNKQYSNYNDQITKLFDYLKIGYWDLFGNWNLFIGIFKYVLPI